MAIEDYTNGLFSSESKSPLFGPNAGLSPESQDILASNTEMLNFSQQLADVASRDANLKAKQEALTKKEEAAAKISDYEKNINSDEFFNKMYADSKGNPVLELGARQALLQLTKDALGNPYLERFIAAENQRLNEEERAKTAFLNQAVSYKKALQLQDYQNKKLEIKELQKEKEAERKALYAAVAQGKITTEEAKKIEKSIQEGKSWVQGLAENSIELKQKQNIQIKKITDNATGKEYYHKIVTDPMTGETYYNAVMDDKGNILSSDIPQYNTFTTRYSVQNIPIREGFGQDASVENLAEYSAFRPGRTSSSSSSRRLIPNTTTSTTTSTSNTGGFSAVAQESD